MDLRILSPEVVLEDINKNRELRDTEAVTDILDQLGSMCQDPLSFIPAENYSDKMFTVKIEVDAKHDYYKTVNTGRVKLKLNNRLRSQGWQVYTIVQTTQPNKSVQLLSVLLKPAPGRGKIRKGSHA